MGTKDIEIEKVTLDDDELCIKGKNFTRKSTVFIDGKKKGTLFVNRNNLKVYCTDEDEDDIKNIVVKQIGLHDISLSETDTVQLSDK